MPQHLRFKSKHPLTWIVLVFVLGMLVIWAFVLEPSCVSVRHPTITLLGWHAEHNDLKIAVLADLHVGAPHMSLHKLQEIVERTNAEAADLVVLLGDLVIHGVLGGRFIEPEPITEVLKNLWAPCGVIAVLGNHDWWYNGERVGKALQQAGIHVLENDVMRIDREGQSFWLAGLADLWTRKPDIEATLRRIPLDRNPIIMLTHNPDVFPDIPARVSLTLAGHTHGGQVNLPFIGRPIVPSQFGQRYAIGHITEQGRHLFVSGGIGTSIIPMRFRVPPEIVILTIRGAVEGPRID